MTKSAMMERIEAGEDFVFLGRAPTGELLVIAKADWVLGEREGEPVTDDPLARVMVPSYGVQPTPTTCAHCGAPRTCCAGAKA